MPAPVAYAVGVAIYVIGRIIIQFAVRVGTRVLTRYILPVVRSALTWFKREIGELGREALFEAIEFVIDFITGSAGEMKEYIKLKSSDKALKKQGSPRPTGGRQPQYQHLYNRPIPYRPIIARVLCFANSNPIPGKRKRDQNAKKENEKKDASNDRSGTVPQLRQLAATVLFEILDLMLEWKSPLKADLMYLKRQPLLTTPDFRPKRVGFSYKIKSDGTISPDIAIVEDRHKAPTLDNLFAIVEVKFPGDPFKPEQEQAYEREFKGIPLALIRVPEDCDCDKQGTAGKKKPGKGRRGKTS